MALDPRIILQAGQGVTPLKTPQEIQAQRAAAEMQQMQLQQARQGMADDQAYRQVLQSGVSGGDLVEQLRGRGLGKQAQEAQKFQSEQQKAQLERGKMTAEGMKNGAAGIIANPTEQNAIATLDQTAAQYGLPREMVDGAKARIYAAKNDPVALRQLAMGWGGDAEKVLGEITSVNLGGSVQQQRVNPITGQVEVFSTQEKTASPDAMLSANTTTQNNLRTVGATMRGQDMTDTRAREEAARKTSPRSLPPPALKMLNDDRAAIATASGINADLGAIKTQIDSGKLGFGPISNLANRARNAAGISSEESRNFGSFQSTLEKLRNDSLRLNAGVQTDGDAVRAWNELFQNINDTKLVRQRLEEIERINQRAVALRQMSIDRIRENYNMGPEDTSAERNQPAALASPASPAQRGAASSSAAPKGNMPKQKAIQVGGREMMAERAGNGKYYVQVDGGWAEVQE